MPDQQTRRLHSSHQEMDFFATEAFPKCAKQMSDAELDFSISVKEAENISLVMPCSLYWPRRLCLQLYTMWSLVVSV